MGAPNRGESTYTYLLKKKSDPFLRVNGERGLSSTNGIPDQHLPP
jgi:hypothetical protein